jgi:GNAT superfamily N-acetyltransferase
MPVLLASHDLMRIERAAVRAWPAFETADVQGWLWRYSGGGSQRANSVSPLAFDGGDVEAAIAAAERRYLARQAAPMFQISDVVVPAGLDRRLEDRGYRLQEPCTCLAKALGSRPEMPAGIEVADRAGEDWSSVYLAGITPGRRATAPQILARVPRPSAFLLRRQDGVPISVALAVVHAGVVIAECVATLAAYRRRGASEHIMCALEAWGVSQGANLAALQAVAENAPAQALYAKLGYHRVGGYHYRVLDR